MSVSEEKLYRVLEYILNDADTGELDVIRAALRRREDDTAGSDGPGLGGKKGAMGVDVGSLAKESAQAIQDQLGVSRDQIRRMVQGHVRDIIAQNAPELDEEQIDELIGEWVPDPETRKAREKAKAGNELPAEAALTMIKQFISFSTGAMSVTEEQGLRNAMSDWHKRYWERFSPVTRKLVSLFLRGVMDGDEFWRGIYDELGIEPD